MSLNIKIPEISKQVRDEDVFKILNNFFNEFAKDWGNHQIEWVSSAYQTFKDHDKFLIVIYLVKKTLDFYSSQWIKQSFETFYSKDKLQIEKFSIHEIAKDLQLAKETARRKILELENIGAIKRQKKRIILDRSLFPQIKPINSTRRAATLLSKFAENLDKHLNSNIEMDSKVIHNYILNEFTYAWKLYYEMQIPIVLQWKKYFGDLETWHIWGIVAVSQNSSNSLQHINRNYSDYISDHLLDREKGLNAMTISDITGIPRATVVRKLKILVKNKFLVFNKKKLYFPSNFHQKDISNLVTISIKSVSVFSTKIYNQLIFNKN